MLIPTDSEAGHLPLVGDSQKFAAHFIGPLEVDWTVTPTGVCLKVHSTFYVFFLKPFSELDLVSPYVIDVV